VEPVLAEAGLLAELADALDDACLDPEIRQETDEALALTGKDVGTPIIQFRPPDGVAFFGPVISRVPAEADAVPLWDNALGLASFAGFAGFAGFASGRSCAASAENPARPTFRRTGTAAAAASASSARDLGPVAIGAAALTGFCLVLVVIRPSPDPVRDFPRRQTRSRRRGPNVPD
jgi:hypothetical protein